MSSVACYINQAGCQKHVTGNQGWEDTELLMLSSGCPGQQRTLTHAARQSEQSINCHEHRKYSFAEMTRKQDAWHPTTVETDEGG